MTPDEWTTEAQKRRDAQRPKTPKRRTGKTPEAKVAAECRAYLKRIGALVLRTGAGLVEVEGRKIAIGRAGSSDDTALLPGGYWLSLEYKSERGVLSDLQRRYGETVTALGGLFVVARGKADVRAALVQRFGEAMVISWERKQT